MSEKEAPKQRILEGVATAVALMRSRGVVRLKMPWFVETDQGEYHDTLEIELGSEPSPAILPGPTEPAESEEAPKRGPDGLTEEEAKLAYGHHRRR